MSLAAVGATPARADDAAALYDPGAVTTVDLGLTEAAKQALRDDPRTYTDATLTLTVGDQQIGPYAIGAKLKGMNTFRSIDGKAAFRLKFAYSVPKQKILGLKSLTLNNLTSDYSMVRETISYGIFRAAGVPAPRTGYAYVRVNDEPFGFYVNVEPYDSVSLDRLFPQGTQHLYEGNSDADVDVFAREYFEVDEGNEDDQADLDALIAATDADGDFSDNVAGVADLTEMTNMWATESFVGHWDGYSVGFYPSNYFLHSDPSGVFRMLPWSTDQTLSTSNPEIGAGVSRLITKCNDDTSCWNQWKTALRRASAAFAASAPGDALGTAMGTVAAWRACPAREAPSDSSYQTTTEDVRTFLAGRRKDVADYLGKPAPPATTLPPRPAAGTECPAPPTVVPTPSPSPSPSPSPNPSPEPSPSPSPEPSPSPSASPSPSPEPSPWSWPEPFPAPIAAPADCVVPKLAGHTLGAARRRLAVAHCTTATVIRRQRPAHGHWRVKTTRPRAGAVRPNGTAVVVVLKRKRSA